ncbi:Hypothetical protein A7982_10942 [Minicystis rosea]|nr:Hypothetical protein A7982_10942 [Minicystis rosea]
MVVDGKLNDAIRELKWLSYPELRALRKRLRESPKPSEKRRRKHYDARRRHHRLRWLHRGDDLLEQARRDQAMYTERGEREKG